MKKDLFIIIILLLFESIVATVGWFVGHFCFNIAGNFAPEAISSYAFILLSIIPAYIIAEKIERGFKE